MRRIFVVALLAICPLLNMSHIAAAQIPPDNPATLLNELGKSTKYKVHSKTGHVRMLIPQLPTEAPGERAAREPETSSPVSAADRFLGRYGRLFGIANPAEDLVVKRTTTEDDRTFVRYRQQYKGIPVIAGELIVQLDKEKRIKSAHGEAAPMPELEVVPKIGADAAKAIALKVAVKQYQDSDTAFSVTEPVLSIYNPSLLNDGENRNLLAWQLEAISSRPGLAREYIVIDAVSGRVLLHFNQIKNALYRKIYDQQNDYSKPLPGVLVRLEGWAPSGIADADKLYDYVGDTYSFYYTKHVRNSINNAGMAIVGVVNSWGAEGNAYWDGENKRFVFGSGMVADDVVAHEYTHGVTDFESNLFYYRESGAINESLSDLWGEFVDLTNNRGNDDASVRWLLGEDTPSGAARDMLSPAAYDQPDSVDSPLYYCDDGDSGGVHINNGVNNRVIPLLVDGGTFNGATVAAIGLEKTAKIYYEAQRNILTSGSDYEDLYDYLQLACRNLTGGSAGITADDCAEVVKAVDAVAMDIPPCDAVTEAPVCGTGYSPVNVFYDSFESGTVNWRVSGTSGTWGLISVYATSGTKSLYGYDNYDISDAAAAMASSKLLPASAFMHFKHFHQFESGSYDGGVLEYSINGGLSWLDAGSLFDTNGYNGTIGGATNPLYNRSAFVNDNRNFRASRLDLGSLAGQSIRFRFRIGTDNLMDDTGWVIDDVRIYTCKDDPPQEISIIINDGSTYTTSPNVTLALAATDAGSGVGSMRFSNNGTTWSSWVPYGTSYSWALGSTNGTRTVYAQFKDNSGTASATAKDTIVYDSIPPAVSISAFTNPLPAGTTSKTIAGARGANAAVAVANALGTAAIIGAVNYPSTTTWNCSISDLLTGNSTVEVTATDAAGNTSSKKSAVIKVAPTLTVASVLTPTNVSSQTIGGSVSDGSLVTVSKGTVLLGSADVTGTSWSFDVSGLAVGTNTFTVTATHSGNQTKKTVSLVYDINPPAFAIASFTNPLPAGTTIKTISGSREARATVAVAAGTGTAATIGIVNYPSTTTWNCAISDLLPGNSTIEVTATDAAGNTSAKKIVVIKVAPTLTVNSAQTPTNVGTQTIGGTVTEGALVTVAKGTLPLGPADVSGTSWSFSINTLVAGTNTFTVTASHSGNTTKKTVSIVYDTKPPALTIAAFTNPLPGGTTSKIIGGSREARATITVENGVDTSATIGTVNYPSSTTWNCALSDLQQGDNRFTVTATDLAGNQTVKLTTLVVP